MLLGQVCGRYRTEYNDYVENVNNRTPNSHVGIGYNQTIPTKMFNHRLEIAEMIEKKNNIDEFLPE